MQDMSFSTLMVVFEEIFGQTLFWSMIVAGAVLFLAYIYVLIRDRTVNWKKFLWAQFAMPFGAVAAIWFVLAETHSHLSDIGGAIDVILMLAIAVAGAVVSGILVYTLESLLFRRPQNYHAH